MKQEITGTVVLQKGGSESFKCQCCEGEHVYCQYLKLDDYESAFPAHFGKDLDGWLKSYIRFKDIEGKRIKITAEIL